MNELTQSAKLRSYIVMHFSLHINVQLVPKNFKIFDFKDYLLDLSYIWQRKKTQMESMAYNSPPFFILWLQGTYLGIPWTDLEPHTEIGNATWFSTPLPQLVIVMIISKRTLLFSLSHYIDSILVNNFIIEMLQICLAGSGA